MPKGEAFRVARAFEREAEQYARRTLKGKIFGTKCWYCDACLIEKGAQQVLIGLNPGGAEVSEARDQNGDYLALPYTRRGYNAWLDDKTWEGKGPAHQLAVRQAFKSMYSTRWEEKLRQTACFNVVPFRTPNASILTKETWNWGAKWSTAILEHIAPKLIVCNGNGGKSAWRVLCSAYKVGDFREVAIGSHGSTASLKVGIIASGGLKGAKVVGLPFLNRFGWPETFDKLKELRPFS
ncbi:MAG: hypothetical protein HY680_02670 [Chloroflexi bacterium]|nr:hypothetical protein [Chloroflexota bacterium]